ncbi:hypothetical protein ABPG72_007875 [Tetrahymena utriculariae]
MYFSRPQKSKYAQTHLGTAQIKKQPEEPFCFILVIQEYVKGDDRSQQRLNQDSNYCKCKQNYGILISPFKIFDTPSDNTNFKYDLLILYTINYLISIEFYLYALYTRSYTSKSLQ